MNKDNAIIVWTAAFLVSLAFFYAMDLLIMGAQGLPLNPDLTPAQ